MPNGTPTSPTTQAEKTRARQLREKIAQARKMAAKVKAAPAAVKEAALETAQTFTGEALKQSWLNLISSFGLTYLYVLFHFVMAYIVGSQAFCKFGEEWGPPKAPKAQKEFMKGFGAEIFEIILMISIALGIAIIILVPIIFFLFLIGEACKLPPLRFMC